MKNWYLNTAGKKKKKDALLRDIQRILFPNGNNKIRIFFILLRGPGGGEPTLYQDHHV